MIDQDRADNMLIGFLLVVIVTVVVLAAFNALDADDTKQRQPLVPATVYHHPPEEEP